MTTTRFDWQQHIVKDPEVMAGKPVVRGTRIPVGRGLAELANASDDPSQVFQVYPELSPLGAGC